MLKVKDFPMCCTSKVLCDFGGTSVADGYVGAHVKTKDLEKEILRAIWDYGHHCLTAFTNDQQKKANKLLLKHGFQHSVWMSKSQHRNTKIRLWWREPGSNR